MSRPEDTFTSTVDGAAAFERHYGRDDYEDDRPTLLEVQRDEQGWDYDVDGDQVVFSDGVPSGEPPACPGPQGHARSKTTGICAWCGTSE